MVCSCNLSAGEVEMGWGSLEFSCPPALPSHLISEPRVSSYSASTNKVDSTESRTGEAFEWPESSWSILTPGKKSKITIHPTKKSQESRMFLPSGAPCLQNILHSSYKRTLVGLGPSCPVSLPFPVCPFSESPSKLSRLLQICIPGSTFFFFFAKTTELPQVLFSHDLSFLWLLLRLLFSELVQEGREKEKRRPRKGSGWGL